MRSFFCTCPAHPRLFFESTSCEVCGKITGFCDADNQLYAFDPVPETSFFRTPDANEFLYKKCKNYSDYTICNGMIRFEKNAPANDQELLCDSCRYTKTIPDLSIPEHVYLWKKLETAKRRALFTLKELTLPIPLRDQDDKNGLCFHFLADKTVGDHFRSPLVNQDLVFTGHDEGEITINLAEADEVARIDTKESLRERYRTLLGHFRHELGHYFWDRLIATDPKRLDSFREYFGDERADYQAELDRHYSSGPPQDWQKKYISAYATMHPWEDWAETWAHYMHMVDTLETAQGFSLRMNADVNSSKIIAFSSLALPQHGTYFNAKTSIDEILQAWINFSVMLNSLNRSMGMPDAYPFVLFPAITKKFKFVHDVIYRTS